MNSHGAADATAPQPFELLETIRWTPTDGWFLLDRHLARLERSAAYFRFPHRRDEIVTTLDRAVEGSGTPQRVRLLVGSCGDSRVEHAPLDLTPRPMRVRLAAAPIDPSDVFLYHKTTNRRVYEQARLADCDDVVLWNPARDVTETTIANLVVDIGGRRVTPPVEAGLLPGTMRAELLARGEIGEERVTIEQLQSATRLWLVNSVRGWCPALFVR